MLANICQSHAYDLSLSDQLGSTLVDLEVEELPAAVLASGTSGCVGTLGTASTLGSCAGTAATSGSAGCGGGAGEDLAF
jgi:hypothetical protein